MTPDLRRIVQILVVLTMPFMSIAQELIPLKGTWNGYDHRDHIGVWNTVFQKGYLDGSAGGSITGVTDLLGFPGDLPLTLDFIGDDRDEIALYRPATRELVFFKDFTDRTSVELIREIANSGDAVVTGDWDGDGKDGFALYRPLSRELWFYQDIYAQEPFFRRVIGKPGDEVIAGNWDGKRGDEIALWRKSSNELLYFREISSAGYYHQDVLPSGVEYILSGDWNADGTDEYAGFRKSSSGYEFLFSDDEHGQHVVQWVDRWNAVRDISGGRQVFYTQGVPHTDREGNFRTSYDEKISFLPKGIYNADPGGFADIYEAGFNLAFLWQTYCPMDAPTLRKLDETGNNLRAILYLTSPAGKPFTGRFNAKRDLFGITSATGAPFVYVDTNGDNKPDRQFSIGDPGDVVVSGDWDGNHIDEFALYRSSARQLIFVNSVVDPVPYYVADGIHSNAHVVSGDWNGDSRDGFAVLDAARGKLSFYERYDEDLPFYAVTVAPSDVVVCGDWDGDGTDGYATWNKTTRTFSFYQTITSSSPFKTLITGETGDIPVSGDWNFDNVDGFGMYRADTTHSSHAFHLYNFVDSNDPKVVKFGNPVIESPSRYVYGIYTADEPGGKQSEYRSNYNHLKDVYSSYSSASPQVLFHTNIPFPTGDHTEARDWWKKFAVLGEASVHDDYPVCNTSARNLKDITSVATTVTKSRLLNNESKPNWFVTQGFEKHGGKRFNFSVPTPEQYSAMVYASLAHGATGIYTFSYDNALFPEIGGISPGKNTALWMEAKKVNGQLDVLKPFLLSPTSDKHYAIYTRQAPEHEDLPVRTLLKYYKGYYLLLVVNMTRQPLDIIIQLPTDLTSENDVAADLLGGTSSQIQSGAINASLTSFGVHAYRFAAAAPVVESKGFHQVREVSDTERPRTSVYPNPADRYIVFEVNDAHIAKITIDIFDSGGRLLHTLTQRADHAGVSRINWNGLTSDGDTIPSGLYFYKIHEDSSIVRAGTFIIRR